MRKEIPTSVNRRVNVNILQQHAKFPLPKPQLRSTPVLTITHDTPHES